MPIAHRLLDRVSRAAFPGLRAALLGLLVCAGAIGPARAEVPPCSAPSLLPGFRASGDYAALETAAAAVPNGEGRVFRLRKAGIADSTLFGTMHLTDPRILALPAAAKAGFDAASTVVIETTDILDEAGAQASLLARSDLINLPAGKTLDDFLDPAQRASLTAALDAAGIPLQAIETLQPWFFAAGMMMPACETARMAAGAQPLDLRLAADAEAAGKAVLGLETASEQLEAMASLPMRLQVDSLIATLVLKDKLPSIFETMTELYLDGKIAMITPLSEAVMPEELVTPETIAGNKAFEALIVTKRNHVMAERALPILAKGNVMVAVGALHLPGEEGLVALLRAKGFSVERLD